jgi:hypothetical protein
MQDLKMDLALDAAQLLGPKARLELRALESGRLLLLVVEEDHRRRQGFLHRSKGRSWSLFQLASQDAS